MNDGVSKTMRVIIFSRVDFQRAVLRLWWEQDAANHGVGSVEKSFVPNILWWIRAINQQPPKKITMLNAAVMKQVSAKRTIVEADIIAIVENVGEKLNHCRPNTTDCPFSQMSSLSFVFRQTSFEFGKRFLMSKLRTHYGDVCSDGDRIVHQILDDLESGSQPTHDSDIQNMIRSTLLDWWNHGDCEADVWHSC